MSSAQDICKLLRQHKFSNLQNEKALQNEIHEFFKNKNVEGEREYTEDGINIFDFFINGIVVEVKINGSKRSIFDQCVRYAKLPCSTEIILITNKSMGFPMEYNGKSFYVVNLGTAWL